MTKKTQKRKDNRIYTILTGSGLSLLVVWIVIFAGFNLPELIGQNCSNLVPSGRCNSTDIIYWLYISGPILLGSLLFVAGFTSSIEKRFNRVVLVVLAGFALSLVVTYATGALRIGIHGIY